MTIIGLLKVCEKLKKEGHGRKRVCVDKEWFNGPLETDGVTIMDVEKAELENFPIVDGDGWIKLRTDGSECNSTCLILRGENSFNYHTEKDAAVK